MMFAKRHPSSHRESRRLPAPVHRERKRPRFREVLAFVELDDEPRLGNPEVAWREHFAAHEIADPKSPERLERLSNAAKRGTDGRVCVRSENGRPAKPVVGQASAVNALQQFLDALLALGTSFRMPGRNTRFSTSFRCTRWRFSAGKFNASPAVARNDDEPPAPKKIVGLHAPGEPVRT